MEQFDKSTGIRMKLRIIIAAFAATVAVAAQAAAEEKVYYFVKKHAVGIERKGVIVQGQQARECSHEALDAYEDLRFTLKTDLSADRTSLRIGGKLSLRVGGKLSAKFYDCEKVALFGWINMTVCMCNYDD